MSDGIVKKVLGTSMKTFAQDEVDLEKVKTLQEALDNIPNRGNADNYDIMVLFNWVYALAALIRLAYFNVQEAMRQKEEDGARKTYTGLPVTSASLIFPLVMMFQFSTKVDITLIYFIVVAIVAVAFVSKFQIPKPGARGLKIMVVLGVIEFSVLIYLKYFR